MINLAPVQKINVLERWAKLFQFSGLFGVIHYGVHINGYTVVDGEVKMWIGQRSTTKPTFPNMYDNMVSVLAAMEI